MKSTKNAGHAAMVVIVTAALCGSSSSSAQVRAQGYLRDRLSIVDVVPSAPKPDEPRDTLDRQVFRASRAMTGSSRWAAAQADDDYRAPMLLSAFSCASGIPLDPEAAPALSRILTRMVVDTGRATADAKTLFARRRPYLVDEGKICITRTKGLDDSPDYPSGHATLGWTAGLIMAQLAPERASELLTRGRAYGESRVVCGVHSLSAIEAGRTTGAAVFAALQSSAEFQADLTLARTEIANIRINTKDMSWRRACQTSAQVLAQSPF